MLVRRLARPMLASIFVVEGLDALRNPGGRAQKAAPLIDRVATAAQPVAEKVASAVEDRVDQVAGAVDAGAEQAVDAVPDAAPDAIGAKADAAAEQVSTVATDVASTVHAVAQGQPLPFESEAYVRANAAVQVGAGVLLATGKLPRVASAALAATLVPTTVAGHPFWELEGDERRTQRIHFLKNLSLLGGLILAAVDTEGRPGVAYRARHRRDTARAVATATGLTAALADVGHAASSHAHDLVTAARESDLPDLARAKAHELAAAARESELPDVARAKAHDLVAAARESDLPERARARAHDLADAARESDLPDLARARAHELAEAARDSDVTKVAAARARELAEVASDRADQLSASAQAAGHRAAGRVRAA